MWYKEYYCKYVPCLLRFTARWNRLHHRSWKQRLHFVKQKMPIFSPNGHEERRPKNIRLKILTWTTDKRIVQSKTPNPYEEFFFCFPTSSFIFLNWRMMMILRTVTYQHHHLIWQYKRQKQRQLTRHMEMIRFKLTMMCIHSFFTNIHTDQSIEAWWYNDETKKIIISYRSEKDCHLTLGEKKDDKYTFVYHVE